MKYILLYEAFKSNLLSSTLGHLSQKGREDFLGEIEKLSKAIDFPKSEISDDFFTYVANVGNKAKNVGTDISLEDDNCLKYWFDVDGNFVGITTVRSGFDEGKDGYEVVKTYTDYEELERDCRPQLIEKDGKFQYIPGKVKTGDKFWIKLESRYLLATAYIQTVFDHNNDINKNYLYMIQDIEDGNTPDYLNYLMSSRNTGLESTVELEGGTKLYIGGNQMKFICEDWKKCGRYSWMISSARDYRGNPELLKFTGGEVIKRKSNIPYYWNYNQINLERESSEDIYKKAHFALVLDFKKLKESNYKKKTQIEKERGETKRGLITPDKYAEIKKMNIQRILDKLSQTIQIDPEFKNLDRMFWKIFNRKTILVDILNESISMIEYQRFIIRISDFISEKEYDPDMVEGRINALLNNITEGVKKAYMNSSKDASTFMDSETTLRSHLNSERSKYPEIVTKIGIFLDKFLELCDSFVAKVSTFEKESIDDLELLQLKFKSVKELYNMDSYSTFRGFLTEVIIGWDRQFKVPNIGNLLSWNSEEDILKRIEKATTELQKFRVQSNKLI